METSQNIKSLYCFLFVLHPSTRYCLLLFCRLIKINVLYLLTKLGSLLLKSNELLRSYMHLNVTSNSSKQVTNYFVTSYNAELMERTALFEWLHVHWLFQDFFVLSTIKIALYAWMLWLKIISIESSGWAMQHMQVNSLLISSSCS